MCHVRARVVRGEGNGGLCALGCYAFHTERESENEQTPTVPARRKGVFWNRVGGRDLVKVVVNGLIWKPGATLYFRKKCLCHFVSSLFCFLRHRQLWLLQMTHGLRQFSCFLHEFYLVFSFFPSFSREENFRWTFDVPSCSGLCASVFLSFIFARFIYHPTFLGLILIALTFFSTSFLNSAFRY